MPPRRKKDRPTPPDQPPKLAIKHVPGKVITIPLMLYPRYMQENGLEVMPDDVATQRYRDNGMTIPEHPAYPYRLQDRAGILIVRKKAEDDTSNPT